MTINYDNIPYTMIQATVVDAGIFIHSIYYNQDQEVISTDTVFLSGKYLVQTSIDQEGNHHRTIVIEQQKHKATLWEKLKTKFTNLLNKEIKL